MKDKADDTVSSMLKIILLGSIVVIPKAPKARGLGSTVDLKTKRMPLDEAMNSGVSVTMP
jgi:hypothetical protein